LQFFSRLDRDYYWTVKKVLLVVEAIVVLFSSSWSYHSSGTTWFIVAAAVASTVWRRFVLVVYAYLSSAAQFFKEFGADLVRDPEWKIWFALPYVRNPGTDAAFEAFFSKQVAIRFQSILKLCTISGWTPSRSLCTTSWLASSRAFVCSPAYGFPSHQRVRQLYQRCYSTTRRGQCAGP
jgi:hypothetical protein